MGNALRGQRYSSAEVTTEFCDELVKYWYATSAVGRRNEDTVRSAILLLGYGRPEKSCTG